VRKTSTCSPRLWQILETSDFEIRSPSDSTTWSTLPSQDADDVRLLDDGDERCSERFRGSRKDVK
jgi:hypothetical protein